LDATTILKTNLIETRPEDWVRSYENQSGLPIFAVDSTIAESYNGFKKSHSIMGEGQKKKSLVSVYQSFEALRISNLGLLIIIKIIIIFTR